MFVTIFRGAFACMLSTVFLLGMITGELLVIAHGFKWI